jgi:hypothetical protein
MPMLMSFTTLEARKKTSVLVLLVPDAFFRPREYIIKPSYINYLYGLTNT